ncbi:MAG TPA: hypothetical protein VH370_14190 [Humisphaera sp.]|nr:hypothetical protein [Humisphaera sp.]
MSLNSLLDQSLSLQRPAFTTDASGGSSRSFSTLLANIPCAVSPARAAIVADYARRDMIVDHHVYTTADLDKLISGGVRLGDRLTDGSVFYLIKAVKRAANAMVSEQVVYEMDCEKRS